jgi:hypothetical protein
MFSIYYLANPFMPIFTKSLFYLTFLLGTAVGYAQEIVSPSGGFHLNNSASLEWNIGDLVINDYSNSNSIITQGFNQALPSFIITGADEPGHPNFQVYPNPVVNELLISSQSTFRPCCFQLFDFLGNALVEGALTEKKILNFSGYPSGLFLLILIEDTGTKHPVRILKLK